jgi:RNA polymerase sigma-70 factor, ECF subfamily
MEIVTGQMLKVMTLADQPSGTAVAPKNDTDKLVEQACRDNHDAFHQIFERYARPVLSFLYDLVGRRELAEELTQETFVRAFRALNTLRDERRLSTWLFGIARNVARESFRARPREERKVELDDPLVLDLSDARPLPDGQLLSRELKQVIHQALGKLDEDKRAVFTLKIFHQRSYEEIAEITGSSIPKLKTDLHRAKAEMRRRIRPYLELDHDVQ